MNNTHPRWFHSVTFTDWLLLALSLASGLGSFLGLIKLMGGWNQTTDGQKLVAFLLVAIIQSLLVFALVQWRARKHPLALCLYGVLTFNSVTMAAGFWGDILHLTAMHAGQRFNEAITASMSGFSERAARFQYVAEAATQLAHSSEILAERERKVGYTCGQYPAGPGERMKYRQRDVIRFNAYARHFTRRQQNFEALLGEARKVATSSVDETAILNLRGLVDQANGLLADPELDAYKAWLPRRMQEAQIGVVINGQIIRCPLAQVADRLRAIRAVTLLPILPPGQLISATDTNAANIIVAYEASMNFVSLRWDRLSKPQLASLMFGALIDLAIFWVAISYRQAHYARALDDTDNTAPWLRQLNSMSGYPPLPEPLRRLLALGIRRNDAIFDLYLPISWATRQEGQLLIRLDHVNIARWRRELPAWRLPRLMRKRFAYAGERAAHYELPVAFLNEWIARSSFPIPGQEAQVAAVRAAHTVSERPLTGPIAHRATGQSELCAAVA